ncbi:MAG: immunoglobulin domain-containing protein [Phycisphaerae bacterium]|nr:immunoglobulin domain-containing protein [Phycisphaerae bacterium]
MRLLRVASTLVFAFTASAQPVLLTGPVTLNPGAATITPTSGGDPVPLATAEITVEGTTLTVNGPHTIASLTLRRSAGNVAAVVTHDANFVGGGVNGLSLTITGDLIVQGADGSQVGSRIDVSGKGWPFFQGPGLGVGSGQGAGSSGHGGSGTTSYNGSGGGGTYGSAKHPVTFGTGAKSYPIGSPPGGGGCVRLIVGGTASIDGQVIAEGGFASFGFGGGGYTHAGSSGGSVWITTHALQGSGSITAHGGQGLTPGGGGRIAVECHDPIRPSFSGLIAAWGGHNGFGGSAPTLRTSAGTVSLRSASARGLFLIDGGTTVPSTSAIPMVAAGQAADSWGDLGDVDFHIRNGGAVRIESGEVVSFAGNLVIDTGSKLELNSTLRAGGDATIGGAGAAVTISHAANTPNTLASPGCFLDIAGDATIAANATLNGDGRGYPPYTGPGFPTHGGGAGSGHGGRGGPTWQNPAQEGGGVYGSTTQPTTYGSGGVNQNAGGGAFRLSVAGNLTLDGAISVNQAGAPVDAGWAASGGSVWITTGGVFSGSGTVRANGLASRSYGGGGRIAVYYGSSTFSGLLQAQSGLSPDLGGNMSCAAPGTVLRKVHAAAFPDVTLDAGCTGPQRAVSPTLMSELGTGLGGVEIRGGTQVRAGEPYIFNGDLTAIGPATRIDATGGLFALGDVTLTNGVRLSHTRGVKGFHLAAGGDMYIDANCTVDADGLGYGPGQGPGSGGFSDCWPSSGGGGGHGGAGGIGWNVSGQCHTTPGGGVYGSAQSPIELGSAGGNTSYGCNPGDYAIYGGGAVRLSARGELRVLCLVTARGLPGVACASSHSSGAGAGGSIWLAGGGDVIAPDLRAHGGGYTTGGGPGACYFLGGPGGGGRVAVYAGGTISGDFGLPGSTEQTAANPACPDRSDPFARYAVRGGWAAPLRGDCACYQYGRPTDGWDGSLVLEEFAHPGGITAQPQSVQRPLGSEAAFSVGGEPGGQVGFEAAYQWRRDGIALRNGPQPGGSTVSGATSADLRFDNLSESDAGTIDVIYFTASGPILSDAAQLSIGDPCPADFNQDGGIDGGDVEAFFAAWEMGDAAADVNQDGGIDGGDVGTFFDAWEAGGCN